MANNNYNREFNVTYRFNADVREFNRNFNNLTNNIKTAFQSVQDGSETFNKMTIQMHEAAGVAAQLRQNLGQAFNTSTGRLDFTQFTKSMRQAGYEMQDYVKSLQQLGPAGETAFKQLGNAILNSEIQMKRAHPILDKFVTSLGRVALYQFSTKAISMFTSSIREAFQFTQELNRSLNEIRIVTKMSTDEMASFAIKANEAAQALSSTTTAYTDASLIYFQQGLSEEEAMARTNVTLKMANVTGESVKTISNDLTAIWNNFADGSKSLEYYADVMTKLGATTASSSKEIATGLEKFAPIAQTVGLSYEYAASALATVSAETRASADIVGTAFKTIFARLESLKLGETLEDGVGLTKYTSAVEAIGVSVMDTNGEMRKLDDILKDIGAKWQELDSAQKSALANTVAGVRQYSQFMALMENWDKVEMNVDVSLGSEGELQEQQEIYAESWEGASKRVKDSLQQIYMMLLDDEGFITMLNGINEVIKALRVMLKTIGGLPGLLATISNLVLTIKGDVLATSMGKYMESAFLSSKKGIAYQENQRQIAIDALKQQSQNTIIEQGGGSLATDKTLIQAPIKAMEQQQKIQHDLIAQKKQMSEEEKGIYQAINNNIKALSEQGLRYSELSAKAKDAHQQALKMAEAIAVSEQNTIAYSQQENTKNNKQQVNAAWNGNGDFLNAGRNYVNSLKNENSGLSSQQIGSLTRSLNQYEKAISPEEKAKAAEGFRKLIEKYDQAIKDGYEKAIQEQASKNVDNQKIVKEASDKYINNKVSGNQLTRALDLAKDIQESNKSNQSAAALKQTQEQAVSSVNNFKKAMEDALNSEEGGVGKLTDSAKQAIEDFIKTVNSGDTSKLSGNIKALNDELEKTKENANGALEEMKNVSGEDATQTFKEETDTFINSEFSKQRAAEETSNALEAQKQVGKQTLKEWMKDYQQLSQQMMSVARGISGIVQVYNTIRGAIDTLTDESMSPLEKMMAIFTTMPSLIFGVSSAMQLFTISSKGASGAAGELGIASAEAAVGETSAGAAGAAATPGLVSFGAGMTAAMGPVGLVVAAIAGFIAIVTVAISLIAKFNEEARKNSLDYKISQLNEEVQEANENFATLQEKSLAFTQTASEYDKLIEKFKNLSSSSSEYKETLSELLKLQNQMIEESAGLDYVRKYYTDLGYTYSEIFDSNGLLTDLGRSLAESYDKEFYIQAQKRRQQANIQLDLLEKEQRKQNIESVEDVVVSNIDSFSSGQVVRTVASALSTYIQGKTGRILDFETDIFDKDGRIKQGAYDLLQQAIPNLNDTSTWVETAKESGYRFLPDGYYGGSDVQAAVNNYLKNIFTEAGRNTSINNILGETLTSGNTDYSYDYVNAYNNIIDRFLSDYLNYDYIESVYDTYLKGTSDGIFNASAISFAYKEAFDKASQEAKNKSRTEEGINQLTDLLKSRKILKDNDNVVFETATNGEVTYKISNSSTKETTEGILQLTEYIDLLSSFDQDIAKAYNNALKFIDDADAKYDLYNKVLESEDWRNLTEQELLKFAKDLGFETDKSGLDLYTSRHTDNLSINERSILYNFNKQNEDLRGDLWQLGEDELKTLSQMIEDTTISVSDNFKIAANLLGTIPEKLSPVFQRILEESQTVGLSIAKSFAGEEGKNYYENAGNLQKFLSGEVVDNTFLQSFDLLKYTVEELDQETGKIIRKIDPTKIQEVSLYAQNLLASALEFNENVSEEDLLQAYGSVSTLKETISLHQKINNANISYSNKLKERNIYQQQFNKYLKEGLETIGSSEAEWDYYKKKFLELKSDLDDTKLYIWLEFKHKGTNLKEALDSYIESGSLEGSQQYLDLSSQIMDIFNVSSSDAFALIGDEIGATMLKNLFSDNEEEANEAWSWIQEFFRRNEIRLYINSSIDSDFQDKANNLYAEFEEALKKDNTLTWDLFIQSKIDDRSLLQDWADDIGKTKQEMEKANAQLAGLGFQLEPIYGSLPSINIASFIEDITDDNAMARTKKLKSVIKGYKIKPLKSSGLDFNPYTGDTNPNTSTPAMYESKKQDTSLRFQAIKKEIEDLSDEADDLRKKLNLDISLNLPEDETKYEDILEKRIGLYEQLEQASKNYLESDKENAIKAYNELNNALGGGLADLFEGDKFNKEEFERSYIDLMNSNFANATKESADAVEQLKEEVDYYTDSWEAAANQQKEATKALKEARQELEKWQRFDKVLDRYNTEQRLFNAQLADEENRMKNINREMQRQEQLASQSTGPQKIAYIDKTIDLLHKQTEELKEQDEISKRSINNIIAELTSLNQSYNLDIDLTNLENHKLILEEEVYEVLKAQFEAMYGQTKSSEEINALVEEYLKKIKEANELIQKMADNQSTIWGYEAQEQAKNYEKLVEKLNAQLTKTKNELTLISYNFSTLSSNFYTMGEAAALFGQQGEQYIENLEAYKNHLGSLKEAYENTKISQTDYVQGLQQVFDGIMENLNSIEQLDQQVKTYYGQTLQAANAELSAHTAGITRATATLNHYLSVMQMINRQTDYASLGKVYEGLVKTTKNEYDVAVANYEMLKKQEENARQLLEQYSDDKTSKSFEIANQTWQDAAAAMDQAYSDMLSKMEAWTQAIVDNFQNTIHKLQQTLENELTDGTNFDTLITQIERLKTADDEYLTRTNQVYELNKLAREAQKQMDEQVNSVSKQRLGQFINETNALKDRNKFSNLELEIQRARYELLLAEMAVEDARANKNKVRLQRDSEGGYGYVYTAEADDVSDAVQKYEDAQNRLYNIGLENADNYTNKRVQTAKEWFDTMVQIEEDYQNGTIESEEEYRNRQDEATQYYYQRLQNYAELYQIALHETDENVILDSWTTHTTIEGHTEKWKDAMDKYVGEVRVEWEKYRQDLTYANEEVGRTAEETEGKVKLLTTASQELTDSILSEGGLISALDTQLGAVLEQVGAYTEWRDSIKGVIEEMKKLAELTAKDINDQNGVGGSPSASAYEGQDISRLMAANQLRKYELEHLNRDLTAEESDEYNSLIKEYSTLIAARNEKMKHSEYANELTTEQIDSIIKELLWYEKIDMLKELAQTGGKLFDSLKTIVGLDTGGYTGEWSNDGRLAFLHQRELVLNAEDTQNILSAVGMVRQMDSLLEGFTFGQGLTPGTMQQQVTIHAEFPNVQDHNEIELAFNDLVNRASQYIMAR